MLVCTCEMIPQDGSVTTWSRVEMTLAMAHKDSPDTFSLSLPSGTGSYLSGKGMLAFMSGKIVCIKMGQTFFVRRRETDRPAVRR